MSSRPWYPFYWSDYSGKTMHLTQGQHGAYFLLLRWIYTTGKPVPHERRASIAQAQLEGQLADTDIVLAEFFERKGKNWHHRRAEEVMNQAEELHKSHVNRGKIGGQRRAKAAKLSSSSAKAGLNHITTTTTTTPLASANGEGDEAEFTKLHGLLGFDGNDHKNWLKFVSFKTHHGLDFEKHILPAAQHHAAAGKLGKTIGYILPKAIELKADSEAAANAPVPFENCDEDTWRGRLKFYFDHPEFQGDNRWPRKWGPIFSDPKHKVPPSVFAEFKPKMNGNGHDTR